MVLMGTPLQEPIIQHGPFVMSSRQQIMQAFDSKADTAHFAATVDHETVVEEDYNLSVSSYVEAKDTREMIDITELNAELKTTVAKIDQLRADIDTIVAGIELKQGNH